MRRRLAEVTAELGARRPVAVVGSFHAAALLPGTADKAAADGLPATADVAVPAPGSHSADGMTTALIPYTFDLLDSRSGYPAGIRDPEWQQDVFAAGGRPELVEAAAARRSAGIAARLRDAGHVAGVPDTTAAFRLARDLAALRGLAAPGRRELVEALTSALAQGEPLGRARAVARAAHEELVGVRRGEPAPSAPVAGLLPHVEALLAELGLPGPGDAPEEREIRLDPLRSARDRARHIALSRLRAAGVVYGEERSVAGVGGAEALGRVWRAAWRATTAATLELAACYGVTLERVAHGRLAARARTDTAAPAGELAPDEAGRLLTEAAECALPGLVADLVARVETEVLPRAGLPDAVNLHGHVERIAAGQVPGIPRTGDAGGKPEAPTAPLAALDRLRGRLAEAAVAAVAGVAGSTDPADAAAVLRVVRLVQGQADRPGAVGAEQLLWQLRRLAREGGPLAQGAADGALVLMDRLPAADFGARLAGWLDLPGPAPSGSAAEHGTGGAALAHRLAGALTVASPVIEGDPGVLDLLGARVEHWGDSEFLSRLPALRDGFDTLSAGARERFLDAVTERLGEIDDLDTEIAPEQRAAWAAADVAARAAVEALLPGLLARAALPGRGAGAAEQGPRGAAGPPARPGVPGTGSGPRSAAPPSGAADDAAAVLEAGTRRAAGRSGDAALPGAGGPETPLFARAGSSPGADDGRPARPGIAGEAPGSAAVTPPPGRSDGREAGGPAGMAAGSDGTASADAEGSSGDAAPTAPAAPSAPDGAAGAARPRVDPPPRSDDGSTTAPGGTAAPHGGVSPGDAAGPVETVPDDSGGGSASSSGRTAGPGRGRAGEVAVEPRTGAPAVEPPAAAAEPLPPAAPSVISALDRWRLILGRQRERTSGLARRAGAALDELYGRGHGEGSRGPAGVAGGTEAPMPTAREWAAELEALFGRRVREEVLGRAAARGRTDVLLDLDPEEVTASVGLLEQVLALRGALPESHLGRLRKLADQLIRRLTAELARRLRPALVGLAVPRPTRRPGGPLDLGRTVRANLHTARPGPDGAPLLLPERPVFRTRARRSADWHVHIVVDVSGSMERSTIYAALVAAILHGLPALSVSFTAFSTEVVDLTGRVSDPLGLLLEVAVGGGTDIGAGLAHARGQVTVPGRSIVALITDFEEGGRLHRTLAEVRALAESGVHLLGLAALNDTGTPVYNRAVAERFVAAGMPVAALSPEELAGWIGEKVRG
ncbi:hypothetical protein DEF28_15345 [Marinitenerispora sediminis]|nr:hypothetical protein DEF28_15345 [Marinitenerispora sediminis]